MYMIRLPDFLKKWGACFLQRSVVIPPQPSTVTAVTLQSISANSSTPVLSRVEPVLIRVEVVAILPIVLISALLLALMGGVALRRRSG